ncbi:unnamed protein product [Rhizoctonia solani]|uniref:Uncharacterized protein n=1 Tax=Rhizoctonia solani TaxID=456999 RepID=A0A8H3H756_9AGAM|nr:unnamed protein product [Rhizoctonia solani]
MVASLHVELTDRKQIPCTRNSPTDLMDEKITSRRHAQRAALSTIKKNSADLFLQGSSSSEPVSKLSSSSMDTMVCERSEGFSVSRLYCPRFVVPLEAKDLKCPSEGNALVRRPVRIERRLQTQVFKFGLAKSIHRRVMPSVGKQIVSVPSFVVRHDPQNHIDFARTSLDGRGRVYRKRAAAVANKDGGGDDEDE